LFYLAAYKVLLSADQRIPVTDFYPQGFFGNKITQWLQDLLAPFYLFTKWKYQCSLKTHDTLSGGEIQLQSNGLRQRGNKESSLMNASVTVKAGQLTGFSVEMNHHKTTVQCVHD
jgi:hypothetical protein